MNRIMESAPLRLNDAPHVVGTTKVTAKVMTKVTTRAMTVTLTAATLLAGCGGGGDSATPANYTQADIRRFASLGTSAAVLTKGYVAPGIALIGAVLEGMSIHPGGIGTSTGPALPCGSGGTSGASVNKLAAHVGLRAGDQVTLTFSKCTMAGIVLDGTTRLTVRSTIAAPLTSTFSATFEADLSGLKLTSNGNNVTYVGVVTVTNTDAIANDSFNVKGSTAAGFSASISSSASSSPSASASASTSTSLRIGYAPGTTFDVTGSLVSNAATLKLDGDIDIGPLAATLGMTVSTPTPITGPVPTGSASFVPTTGAMTARPTMANGIASKGPATATTFGASNVTVSGDTDLDGSMETVFTTSWAELMAP